MIDSLTLNKSLGADAGEINHTDFDGTKVNLEL